MSIRVPQHESIKRSGVEQHGLRQVKPSSKPQREFPSLPKTQSVALASTASTSQSLGDLTDLLQMVTSRFITKYTQKSKALTNQVLETIGKERVLLNNILRRKANWIDHILRRNCLIHDAIEGQMTEVKGVGRRRTQILDDLRNRRRKLRIEGMEVKVYQSNIGGNTYLLQVPGSAKNFECEMLEKERESLKSNILRLGGHQQIDKYELQFILYT